MADPQPPSQPTQPSEPQDASDSPAVAPAAPSEAPAQPVQLARQQIIFRREHPDPNAGRSFFATMMLMLFFFNGSGPAGPAPGQMSVSPREMFRNKIERQRHAVDVLNQTQWGDFSPGSGEFGMEKRWLNMTGFREDDGFVWEKLTGVRGRVGEFERELGIGIENSLAGGLDGLAVYENVSGITNGKWVKSDGLGDEFGGAMERINLTAIAPTVIWARGIWDRNITGKEGQVMLSVEEKEEKGEKHAVEIDNGAGMIREVSATLTVHDETSSGEGWNMRLHGVHWPRRGALVMTTTSEKFFGIFGLPHLTTSKEDFKSSQRLLNRTLNDVIVKKEKTVFNFDLRDPWSSDEYLAFPHCEYVVYVQVHPFRNEDLHKLVKGDNKVNLVSEIRDIESELRFPNGATTLPAPLLRMSVVIFSPDCGFVLESKGPPTFAPEDGQHLVGYKDEVFMRRVKQWCLIWSLALFGQVFLIRMQTQEASTPSTVSRISLYTIGVMVIADTFPFVGLMTLANSVPGMFLSACVAAFAAFLGIALEFRFFMDINNVQGPERRERARTQAAQLAATQPAPTQVTAPIITAGAADTLPLPVTAPRTVPPTDAPIIIPSDQDIDAEIAEVAAAEVVAAATPVATPLVTQTQTTVVPQPRTNSDRAARFGQSVLAVFILLIVTASATSWPSPYRAVYINTISAIYLSLWIPQIYRNIIRNCRKALLWKFIIGQSALRLSPFAYFYLKKDNVLFSEPSSTTFLVLAGWVWIQIWALAAQDVLGPRFGVPRGWLPEAWDYHPILREDDVEGAGMPIGLVQVPGSPRLERVKTGEEARRKSEHHVRTVDCAICMNALEVSVVPAQGGDGSGGVAGMLARRQYMVTPCRHVFHTVCLEGWMRFRLQCPICRETLPAL